MLSVQLLLTTLGAASVVMPATWAALFHIMIVGGTYLVFGLGYRTFPGVILLCTGGILAASIGELLSLAHGFRQWFSYMVYRLFEMGVENGHNQKTDHEHWYFGKGAALLILAYLSLAISETLFPEGDNDVFKFLIAGIVQAFAYVLMFFLLKNSDTFTKTDNGGDRKSETPKSLTLWLVNILIITAIAVTSFTVFFSERVDRNIFNLWAEVVFIGGAFLVWVGQELAYWMSHKHDDK